MTPAASPGAAASPEPGACPEPAARHRATGSSLVGLAALLLLCIANWQLSHAYHGIFHDAQVYVLQGLAHLHPESLPHDVFLRLGSQDRYTLFAPLFAATAAPEDPEGAAALLTFIFQLGLFAAVWALARAVTSPQAALVAVAVTIAIPGEYGSDRVFACVEPFLTPRMAGEALTLAALAAVVSRRGVLAVGLFVLAVLMHPIMAAAGLAAAFFLRVLMPRPGLGLAILAAGVASLWIVAAVAPPGTWGRFDADWLGLVVNRSPYLFLSSWRSEDWGGLAVILATLTIGMRALPDEGAGALCAAVLLTTVCGVLLGFVGGDQWHMALIVRLQPWRWQWLGIIVAAMLLPAILRARWIEASGRPTALLLAAAWVFGSNTLAFVPALLAIGVMAGERRLNRAEARLVFAGAAAVLIVTLLWRVASNLQFTDAYYVDSRLPMWLRRATSFVRDGTVPIAVILFTWWLTQARSRRKALAAVVASCAAGCLLLLPSTWSQWTTRTYTPQRVREFAPWRRIVPPSAEVFWPDSPASAWLLLDRPNYLSTIQTSGVVFSRDAALELRRRAAVLQAFLSPQLFLGWDAGAPRMVLVAGQLQGVCDLQAFDYLVTSVDLGRESAATLERATDAHPHRLFLYPCSPAAQARAAAAAT